MSLNKTLFHLLLKLLKSSTLTLVNLLIGSFHLAGAELFDRVVRIQDSLDSIVDLLDVGLSGELSSSLDPL